MNDKTTKDVAYVTPLKKICMTIGELPTSYLETMSYYEMLVWFTNFLRDNIIPAVNNNAEAVTELQTLYEELREYVNNYFDNLDIAEEVDAKLEQMAESGQLTDIIAQYLGLAGMITFDTVADMKLAENLVNGSKCATLGYHTVNDGGNAFYKIRQVTNDDVVDDKFIIELYDNLLVGELICDSVNVKQIGAYGDNTHDDTSTITAGVSFCLENNRTLFIPSGTYLCSSLNFKSIKLNCEGYLNNSNTLILGALSNGSTSTFINLYKCNDVQIEGAKNSEFNIKYCNDLVLYADGETTGIESTAYNKINGIRCNNLTLNGINSGWINENKFDIKRCDGDLTITGDGSYAHNNNRFYDICIEGSTKKITIDCGRSNFISYRGESIPQLIFNNDPSRSYNNEVRKQYTSSLTTFFNNAVINTVTTLNSNISEYFPTFKCYRLFELNKYNVKKINAPFYINGSEEIYGGWNKLFESEKLDASYPFMVCIKCDSASLRSTTTCYDSNGDKVEGNVYITGISYDETNKNYAYSTNQSTMVITFIPSSTVSTVTIDVSSGNSYFKDVAIDMYVPFVNTKTFVNKIRTDKKFLSSTPTSASAVWEVGDVIYNSSPSSTYAWVCTTAGTGTSAVWKSISIS